VLWTERADGDQRQLEAGGHPPSPVPEHLVLKRLVQEHGAVVVAAMDPTPRAGGLLEPWTEGPRGAAPRGDALVAKGPGNCLAILTADCASVALATPEGVFAAVHVGWRGLLAGVVERTLTALSAVGASEVSAGIGPCIHPCCYRFEAPEVDLLAERYGEEVRALTSRGEPALDLPRAVHEALGRAGARVEIDVDTCTACQGDAFSFRARHDEERQALFVWLGEPAT